jgi:outer membrane receptor protein involved in Fe transport
VALVALLCAALAWGQSASITGIVTDTTDALIPGVEVVVTNVATGVSRTAVSNQQGNYSVPLLQPGQYRVTAQASGFKPLSRDGITLTVDQVARIDIRMEVGLVTESIEVVAEATMVDSSNATLGVVVENRRVVDLPLNGRNALALVMLTPAVISQAGPTNSGFANRGTALSAVSINGGPGVFNSYVLDGGNNNQAQQSDINVQPAVDAVEEFKVQHNSMSAEYGFTLGGVVNVVTRSGTNEPHGAVYHFLRNDKLDARNTFAETRAPFRYNQFGGSLGGPIVVPRVYNGANRSFFFTNYEEWRYRRYENPILRVPTAAEREGDFSEMRAASGALIPIYDPLTTRANPSGSGFIRDPFIGNRIPQNRIDAVSRNILQFYPLPNRTPSDPFTNANNYISSIDESQSMRQLTTKLDHRISDYNSIFGRYTYYRHRTDGGVGGSPYPDPLVRKRFDNFVTHNLIVNDTHTINPATINEFRAGLARSYFPFESASYGLDLPGQLGLPDSVPPDTFPAISNGMTSFGTFYAGLRGTLTLQAQDMVTLTRGKHTLKFGGEYRKLQANNLNNTNPSGSYNFGATLTGNPQRPSGTGSAFATFLTGAVSNASLTRYGGASNLGVSYSGFVQDDWKVTRRLTLNLGLRYDYQSWPVDRYDGISNFNPGAVNPENNLLGRMEYASVDFGRSARDADYNNWGPRAGFAFDLTGRGATVLRGGYGIFYSQIVNTMFFGNTAGFATAATTYQPAGNNTNFPAFQFSDGLPSPPIAPLGSALGPSAFLGQNVTYEESTAQIPMSQQWGLSLQQRIGSWRVEVSYSANRVSHMSAGNYDLNQLDPQHLALGLALQDQVRNPYAGMVPGALGNATISRQQALRPFPYYNQVAVYRPTLGSSIYNALLISVERRLSAGFSVLLSYTNGKLLSDSIATTSIGGEQAGVTGYQNGKFNRAAEWSIDPTDVSQRLVISGLYELPFGHGKIWSFSNSVLDGFVRGWQANIISTLQSGLPVVVRGANNFLADRPNSTGVSAKLENPTADRWFDTAQFVNPPNFTFGNVGRVLPDVRSPRLVNFDFSLIKDTHIRERLRLQFRAEAFNVFNQVNLRFPNATFQPGAAGTNISGNFGVITSARDARIMQLGLKLIF